MRDCGNNGLLSTSCQLSELLLMEVGLSGSHCARLWHRAHRPEVHITRLYLASTSAELTAALGVS